MKLSLDELCEFINGGAWSDKEYSKSGIPVLKVSNLQKEGIDFKNIDYIPEESRAKYSRHFLFKNDLVIATVGSHPSLVNSAAGRATIISETGEGYLLNQNAVCLRTKDPEILDQKFLAYTGKTEMFQHFIQQRGKGAANQMRIAIGSIKEYEIELPKITIQRKIASILSVYDDLVENNLRRVNLLEELSLRTYEEWFVNRVINGEIVNDSKFEVRPLHDLIEAYMNGGWGKEIEDGTYSSEAYVIRGTDMPDLLNGIFSSLPLRFHSEKNLTPRKLKRGDIIIEMSNGNMNSVGRSFFFDGTLETRLNKPFMCASFCKMVRPKNLELAYLIDLHLKYIHSTNNMLIYKSQGANGINNFRFEDMINEEEMFVPTNSVFDDLIGAIKSIYELATNLRIQVSLLKEARDILLPRLMSGEISVEEVNKETLAMAAEPKLHYSLKK